MYLCYGNCDHQLICIFVPYQLGNHICHCTFFNNTLPQYRRWFPINIDIGIIELVVFFICWRQDSRWSTYSWIYHRIVRNRTYKTCWLSLIWNILGAQFISSHQHSEAVWPTLWHLKRFRSFLGANLNFLSLESVISYFELTLCFFWIALLLLVVCIALRSSVSLYWSASSYILLRLMSSHKHEYTDQVTLDRINHSIFLRFSSFLSIDHNNC